MLKNKNFIAKFCLRKNIFESAHAVSLAIPEGRLGVLIKVKKEATIRNRYNQILHLTQDTIWESDKNTRKHDTQKSQEVSSFQQVTTRTQGTDKTA